MAKDHGPRGRKKLNCGRESRGLGVSKSYITSLLERGLDVKNIFRGRRRRQKKMKKYG